MDSVCPLLVQNYSNCACIVQDLGGQLETGVTISTVSASSGFCRGECATLLPFMIMLFFMTFVIASTQMPLLMVTIRLVLTAGHFRARKRQMTQCRMTYSMHAIRRLQNFLL